MTPLAPPSPIHERSLPQKGELKPPGAPSRPRSERLAPCVAASARRHGRRWINRELSPFKATASGADCGEFASVGTLWESNLRQVKRLRPLARYGAMVSAISIGAPRPILACPHTLKVAPPSNSDHSRGDAEVDETNR
jgi:hypothetical protein